MAERVIRLFGEPEVTLDGSVVELSVALPTLALFVLWRDLRTASGERLAKALKPDSEAGEPTAFLKKHKRKLRELLQMELPNTLNPARVGPAILEQAWVDVVEFDAKIDSTDSREVREAIELRQRGCLLADLPSPYSFAKERESREKKYQGALARLLTEAEERQPEETPPEEALRGLDRLLACDGFPKEWVAQVHEQRAALEQAILVNKAARGAGQTIRSARFPALPHFPTALIGRDAEIAAVQELLQTPGMVTLLGTAGVGKTRIATAVAGHLRGDFPAGIAFADLRTVADAAQVVEQVGKSLGLPEEKGRSRRETLLAFLEEKTLLLVWDNCESRATACAELAADVLRCAPAIRLLVTSREALRVYGERSYVVRELPESSAVKLFLERARAVKPGFALTDQNRATVSKICRDLDGLPLALELAAAKMDVQTLKWIVGNLHRRFEVLVDAPRPGAPHHASLQIAYDLSYEPLPQAEQALFRALGVFAGSFRAEAVEAVTGDARLLPTLVRKSLVAASEQNDEMQFHLLASAQQYAQARMQEKSEGKEMRRRHRAYYFHLAGQAKSAMLGPEEKGWLDRLETETANLRAALVSYQESAEDGDEWVAMTAHLWRFWWVRGYLAEGRAQLEAALTQATGVSDTARALALEGAGLLAYHLGDFAQARTLLEQAAAVIRRTDQLVSQANILNSLGALAMGLQENAQAQSLFQEALTLYRRMEDRNGIPTALINLGTIACHQGDFIAARAAFTECLGLFRALRSERNIAHALYCFGNLELDEGNAEEAERLLGESLQMFRDWKEQWRCLHLLEAFTVAAVRQEHYLRAGRIWGAALASRRQLESPAPPDHVLHYARFLSTAEQALGENAFAAACAAGQAMTWEQAVAFTLRENTLASQ